MWDFNFSGSFGAMIKTMPFIVFRMAVYLGLGLLYIVGTGVGGAVGYGVTAFGDEPGSGVGIGAFVGFGGAAGFAYWIREYILYIVKAGHIGVLVKHMDGEPLPNGRGQIEHAKEVVKERFAESSMLFALDQIIKGILKVVTGMVNAIASWIPGLNNLASFANSVLKMSLTYVDEIIIAYILRTESDNPFETACRAVVLYAQNFGNIAKNAVWLAILMWVITFVIFLLIVGPVLGLMALFPGDLGGMAVIAAFMLAWSFKAALLEPLCIYALMQVYFKAIEDQEPDAEWEARIASTSEKFRELKERAGSFVPGAAS